MRVTGTVRKLTCSKFTLDYRLVPGGDRCEPPLSGQFDRTPTGDVAPASGITVRLAGEKTHSARTGPDGTFAFFVKKGDYRLTAPGRTSQPTARKVKASRDVAGQDLRLCRTPPGGMYPAKSTCDYVSISGRVQDMLGTPVSNTHVVASNAGTTADQAITDEQGRYELWVPRGKETLLVGDLSGGAYYGGPYYLLERHTPVRDMKLNVELKPEAHPNFAEDAVLVPAWGVLFDKTTRYELAIDAVDQATTQGQCQTREEAQVATPVLPAVLPWFVLKPTTSFGRFCSGDWRARMTVVDGPLAGTVIWRNTFEIP